MSPREVNLWTRFLTNTKLQFLRIDYDVRLGPGYDPGIQYPPEIRTMAVALTQLRVDAIGETQDNIIIFEVKPEASLTALGQLKSYGYWYSRQYAPTKPVLTAVVCETIAPNMEPVFAEHGILIFKV